VAKSELVDLREVSRILNVSETTVKELVRDGVLPEGRKLYGCTRWFRSDVRALLDRLRREHICRAPEGARRRRRAPRENPPSGG
jgi:predicted DNA-binding transcriptional regulator AlpA